MPTYNKTPRLALALCSLAQQTFPPAQWELVLVDDGSTQKVEEVLTEANLKCHLQYVFQENSGRSVARNQGIAAARSDLVLFMDDDLIAAPGFIEAHVTAHGGQMNKVV